MVIIQRNLKSLFMLLKKRAENNAASKTDRQRDRQTYIQREKQTKEEEREREREREREI